MEQMCQPHDFRLIHGTSKVDFDPKKEEYNRREHKYSLTCAVDIFESALLFQSSFITSDSFWEKDEIRQMHLAKYQRKIVLIVTTMRDEETIRVISMRDASIKEREIFENNPPPPVG